MRTSKIVSGLIGLIATIGLAGAASAQVCDNTCVGAVDGPKQGVHTRFEEGADAILWPPNHKLRTIAISAVNEDGDPCNVTITRVAQDEPVTGEGSGNTSPDAANCDNSCTNPDDACVDLRGERSGTLQDGRFYNVDYTMEDPGCPMMPAMNTALVLVPHDQGVAHTGVWLNEGPLYDSANSPISCTP